MIIMMVAGESVDDLVPIVLVILLDGQVHILSVNVMLQKGSHTHACYKVERYTMRCYCVYTTSIAIG